MPLLLPLAVGLAVRLTGIRHGEPDAVYHPDVAKQTLVAQFTYRGLTDTRLVFGSEFSAVLADRRVLCHYRDAERLQPLWVTDARQFEQLR